MCGVVRALVHARVQSSLVPGCRATVAPRTAQIVYPFRRLYSMWVYPYELRTLYSMPASIAAFQGGVKVLISIAAFQGGV